MGNTRVRSVTKGPGRPRDPHKREAVLAAVRDLIISDGYGAATIQAISERSGVSRPTIYKNWGDRLSLLEEALYSDRSDDPVPDMGTLEDDLTVLVGELVTDISRPEMQRGLASLHADVVELRGQESPYWAATLSRWGLVFAAASDRGELEASDVAARARLALHMALGSLLLMSRDKRYSRRRLSREISSVLCGGLFA